MLFYLLDKYKIIMISAGREFRGIYMVAGLLLVAGILLITVISSLQQNKVPLEPPPTVAVAPSTAIPENTTEQSSEAAPTVVSQQITPNSAAVSASTVNSEPEWPVKGEILREFGWQEHPVYHDWRFHTGIDISSAVGQPIKAALDGQVIDIYTDRLTGLTVVVKNKRYTLYYGSLQAVEVNKDTWIPAGTEIGTSGHCDAEPDPHLHLGIQEGEKWINPLSILK
jgi:murein DD-endopeptidase MepM/ murein hydrolase activator NlpD